MLKSLSLITGAALVFAVHLGAQPQYGQPNSQPPQKAPSSPATAKQSASTAAQDFLKTVSQDNRAEIELGQLAQSKASNDQVKSYAEMLVSDHTKANDEVTSLAQTKSVTLPGDLTAAQKSAKDKLTPLSGAAFDKQYIDAMVRDHQKAVKAFQQQTKATDADVRAFAQKTLPVLQHHLEEAQRLQKTVGASTASSARPSSK